MRTRATVRAPQLPGDPRRWLNTGGQAIQLPTGRVTLLDFWTYCCINCLHVLPDLEYLEEKYPELLVVGVHSGKFDNEKDAESVRSAVVRLGVRHPVVLDSDLYVWRSYAVRAWPTLVLVDPLGSYVGSVSGEGHREQLDRLIGEMIAAWEAEDRVNDDPMPRFKLEADTAPVAPLFYPGKVLADEAHDRLFIADSANNRIVIATLAGAMVDVVGTGEPAREDGPWTTAAFRKPQGMALDPDRPDRLLVCDTDNHLIRAVDLRERTVATVAGTGAQTHGDVETGPALTTPLSSPWDICAAAGGIYVAMAGRHQIWLLDPTEGTMGVYAGSGREARTDAPLLMAAFAQPSGIATDGSRLWVADSEISAVREVGLGTNARVRTLAGGDLFSFGDRDGAGDAVRLQHPLGIAYHDGDLYLADTYNHKIKVVDPADGSVRTLVGGGHGHADGAPTEVRFFEPGGLSAAAGRLYVADTNNHAIRIVDPETGHTRTLAILGLCAPELCFPAA